MEKIITAFAGVIDQLYFDYIFAAILFNWLVIKYVLPNKIKELPMIIFSFLASLLIAIVFYLFGGYVIKWLFISHLTVNTFYQLFAKWIFKLFNIDYKVNDPELIKKKEDK